MAGRPPTNSLFYTFATMRAWIDRGAQHSPLSRGARVWRDGDERVTRRGGTRQQPPLNFTRERSERRLPARSTLLAFRVEPSRVCRVCAPSRTFTNISNGSAESYQRVTGRRDMSHPPSASRFIIIPRGIHRRASRFADVYLRRFSLSVFFHLQIRRSTRSE